MLERRRGLTGEQPRSIISVAVDMPKGHMKDYPQVTAKLTLGDG